MLRVGIVGTGGISAAHLAGYAEFGEACKVVALADVQPGRAESVRVERGLTGARAYDDPAAMLDAEQLDLVSITTPPSTHADLTIAFLNAGVNVIVEKPMAASLAECDAMIAAQRASGALLSVVAQNRFRDDLATLREVLDSGLTGDVSHVSVNSAWWRGLAYYDLWWRGTWESEGGGPTLNHAIHHIDLLLWLMGTPTAVSAQITNAAHENAEVEDLSVAILSYGRALAQLTSSVVHHGEEQAIVIQGRDARISQPWSVKSQVAAPNGFPSGNNEELIARIEALAAAHTPLAHIGHAGQIGDVISALAEGREPAVTGTDGRNAVELVTAIYRAAIERRTIDLPLASDDPYYFGGTLQERAPHFYAKTGSVTELDGEIVVGASSQKEA